MSRKRSRYRRRKINPHFWVFCEGETEEAYIRFLRSKYRLPIQIISKISGHKIDSRYIQSFKAGKPVHEKDKDFLIFDSDIPEVVKRLEEISAAKLIFSNPSIELWFLLHYKNQTSAITEKKCIRELTNRNRNPYKKGVLDEALEKKLDDKCFKACDRAKNLRRLANPSSNFYEFIEELESVRKMKQ